jgi:uncharacterized protein YkwD
VFATVPAPVGAVDSAVLRDINQIRASHGLGAVTEDGQMDRGARAHSTAMARRAVLTHGSFARRVRRYAGSSTIGEIIGYTQGIARRREVAGIVSAWMGSSEHRAIILSSSFHRAGVGSSRRNGTAYFTVDFAA